MAQNLGNNLMFQNGDLVISANGNLMTTQDYEDNNASTSRFVGYYNALFSFFDRISTPIGDNVFHPDYGSKIPYIVSSPNSQLTAESVKEEIHNCLIQDPRVKTVNYVTVSQTGKQLYAQASVVLIGSSVPSTFIFPYIILDA